MVEERFTELFDVGFKSQVGVQPNTQVADSLLHRLINITHTKLHHPVFPELVFALPCSLVGTGKDHAQTVFTKLEDLTV